MWGVPGGDSPVDHDGEAGREIWEEDIDHAPAALVHFEQVANRRDLAIERGPSGVPDLERLAKCSADEIDRQLVVDEEVVEAVDPMAPPVEDRVVAEPTGEEISRLAPPGRNPSMPTGWAHNLADQKPRRSNRGKPRGAFGPLKVRAGTFGAGGGGRTLTTLRSRDFESRASASFTTPARGGRPNES